MVIPCFAVLRCFPEKKTPRRATHRKTSILIENPLRRKYHVLACKPVRLSRTDSSPALHTRNSESSIAQVSHATSGAMENRSPSGKLT